jgi:beta-glucanase (GH16 family)
VRNNEQQWYQEDNAVCLNGSLVISAKREHPSEKPAFEYTSTSLISQGKQVFRYGRFEMRGKIPIDSGSWPAWWTLGANASMGWPDSGEIDIMEYYRGNVLANFDYGNSRSKSVWNSVRNPVDESWASQFHVWAMEWDASDIKLFLDGKMVNSEKVAAADGTGHANPWKDFPVYMILNLAIGGDNGGDPSKTKFPLNYYVDYVRVYQKASSLQDIVV